nr:putative RNA-dependent RNA polymerase [Binucleate Rhizoctonia mitovirus 17]
MALITMIFILIFLSGMLSLVHYFNLEGFLVMVVGMPLHYHFAIFAILLVVRGLLALRKALPYIRYLMKSIKRLAERDTVVSVTQNPGKTGTQKTKPGAKAPSRSYSTSSFQRKSVNSKPASYRSKPDPYRFSYSKKVMDSFFRVISKEGSLVILNIWRKVKDKDGKAKFIKSSHPHISALFKKLGFRMFGACFPGKGKYSSRLRQLFAFLVHIQNMNRHHGDAYVVKYLKSSQLAIQKAIAGTPVKSLNQIDPSLAYPGLATSGLPKFIPIRDRKLILKNHSSSVIRWWLTLFSVYRVIQIPAQLKLSTITDPSTVPMESVASVAESIKLLINPAMFDLTLLHGKAQFLFLESASSTSRVSWLGMVKDALPLLAKGHLHLIVNFLRLTSNPQLAGFLTFIGRNVASLSGKELPLLMGALSSLIADKPIGRLSVKVEPAGKARVFAMVDVWTQSALSPLHDMLFKFLRSLPNDGTFDQEASVRRCLEKCTKTGKSFGYDLSAATDRLPLSLQSAVIDRISPGLGGPWAELLTLRSYYINAEKDFGVVDNLKYAVGQPMGALSSWAMLAVTHHYIAQLAAVRAVAKGQLAPDGSYWIQGPVLLETFNLPSAWYVGYEVLGDDIVFFEEAVAHEYLPIMDELGVPINLMKSVIATNPTFEFAKVTGHYGHHVAAVSWAMFMAQPTIMGRAGIAYSLFRKGINRANPIHWFDSLARESRYRAGATNTFYLALGTMFSRKGYMDFFSFLYSIMQKTAGFFNVYATLLEKSNITTIKQAIAGIVKTGEKVEVLNPVRKRRGWKTDEFAIRETLMTTIRFFLNGNDVKSAKIASLSPHRDAILLSRGILCLPAMFLVRDKDVVLDSPYVSLLQLENKKVFTLDKRALANMDQYESFVHHLFVWLFVHFNDKLTKLQMEIENVFYTDSTEHYSIDQLMDTVETIARYKEILLLPERMAAKLQNKAIPERNLVDSPLAVLQLLMETDDPFGSYQLQTGRPTLSNNGAVDLQEYLYAQQRIESFTFYGQNIIGQDSGSSLDYFKPVDSRHVLSLREVDNLPSHE